MLWMWAGVFALHVGSAQAQAPIAGERPPDDSPRTGFTMAERPTLYLGSLGEIRFRGRVEVTARTPQADVGLEADARWQTRRLQVEGRLFDRLEFEVSREFGDADEPERDAFLNLRLARSFELQAGRFKMPLGRDALTGGANLDFVYRSLAGRHLAPGRDVGAMAHGRVLQRTLSYEAGFFVGDGDHGRTPKTHGGRRAVAGRILVRPFVNRRAPWLAGVQAAVAVAVSDVDMKLGLRGLTVFREGVFFDRVVVNGRRVRRGLEAAWSAGPVSLTWEHINLSDQRVGMGFDGETLPGVHASGWYVAGTWTLTGEPKRGRVEPRSGIGHGGLGALEVAARYERLAFAAAPAAGALVGSALDTPGNADRVLTLGVAWYLSRYVKLQVNGVLEAVEDPQRSPAPRSGGRFPSTVAQLQVAI
jgi:phosphate-selective porin